MLKKKRPKEANLDIRREMAKYTLQEGMTLFLSGLKAAEKDGLYVSLNVGTSFYTKNLKTLSYSVHEKEESDGED